MNNYYTHTGNRVCLTEQNDTSIGIYYAFSLIVFRSPMNRYSDTTAFIGTMSSTPRGLVIQ